MTDPDLPPALEPEAREPEVAEPAAEPEVLRCPACLSIVEADQAYCLECGERLQPAGRPLRSVLGRELTPRGLGVVVAAAIALAVGGLLIAYGFTRDDGHPAADGHRTGTTTTGRTTTTTTGGLPTVSTLTQGTSPIPTITDTTPTFPTTPTLPPPTVTLTVTTTTQTTTTPGSNPPGVAADDWPNGRNAYAVVLSSKPSDTWTWDQFVAKKATARSQGFTTAGLLDSDDYLSLNAGYYVLFEGPYASKAAAIAALPTARARYADAYVRFISEDQP